jgi:hypothetical protein
MIITIIIISTNNMGFHIPRIPGLTLSQDSVTVFSSGLSVPSGKYLDGPLK